jgi:uncharacterized protein YjeT (DUF2065 family)
MAFVHITGVAKQPMDDKGHGMKFFLCVLGMVMIVEGLPYFAFPEKMKYMVTKMLAMQDAVLRRFGFLLMAGGLFLIYLGKR